MQIYYDAPVADALVGAFDRVSEGDMLLQRGLHAEALACYNQCIDTAGAFEGALTKTWRDAILERGVFRPRQVLWVWRCRAV